MARILGLDLGSYSVKGVMLETTMRSFEVKGFARQDIPLEAEGDAASRLKQAVTALLQQPSMTHADSVVVGMPGLSMVTHSLALPFSDAKRIEATLAFEVEGQLPFDLDTAAFDYQTVSADDKGSQLVVGVLKKNDLSTLLDALKDCKVDPKIVTHPALAYQLLLGELPTHALEKGPDSAVAIIDIGHERTCVAIGRPSVGVEVARVFAGGGLALTRALATEFNVSLSEANVWKVQHAAVADKALGPDAEKASAVLVRALQPVLRELRSTLKSYNAKTRRPIEWVLLCGGTAGLKGLPEQLSRDLGAPTELLPVPGELNAAAGAQTSAAAQPYMLALRGNASGPKAPRFNLRRGEFSFKSDFDFVREKLSQIAVMAAVLFVLLIAGGMVRNSVLESRSKQIDTLLCEITQRVLGKCQTDYSIALNLLRGKESPIAGIPKQSAVTLLAELTSRIPADIPLTMDQITVDLDRISLRCQAGNSKHMEDVIAALKQYKCFKEIKEGKVEKSKDGKNVSFRLDIQVDCSGVG